MVEILRLHRPVRFAHRSAALRMTGYSWRLFLCELAAVTTVENVDQEAEAEPDYEAQPCDDG